MSIESCAFSIIWNLLWKFRNENILLFFFWSRIFFCKLNIQHQQQINQFNKKKKTNIFSMHWKTQMNIFYSVFIVIFKPEAKQVFRRHCVVCHKTTVNCFLFLRKKDYINIYFGFIFKKALAQWKSYWKSALIFDWHKMNAH